MFSAGATVVVTEHNPRIIGQADYIIELGPAGGETESGKYILCAEVTWGTEKEYDGYQYFFMMEK